MWLINTSSLELEYFVDPESDGVRYAILSHTWARDQDEVTFQQFADKQAASLKPGFAKIQRTCDMARAEGLDYAWVDTCCIDKSSSAELSEAINSMFAWYRASSVCYAYLTDLDDDEPLRGVPRDVQGMFSVELALHRDAVRASPLARSRWFTRGWTLQELIAPPRLRFYDARWREFGTKRSLHWPLQVITHVDASVLLDSGQLLTRSVWRRMSWAATRDTKRVEDIAYCLLGIFDISMPLIYGEGYKAFQRLQEEITRKEGDVSILDWHAVGMPHPRYRPVQYKNATKPPESRGAFAWAPSEFIAPDSMFDQGNNDEGLKYGDYNDAVGLYSPNFNRNDADEAMGRIRAYKLEMGPQSSVVIRCREGHKIKATAVDEFRGLGSERSEYTALPTPKGLIHRSVIFHNFDGFAFRSEDPDRVTYGHKSVEREYENFRILGQHRAMVLEAMKGTRCTINMNGNPTFTDVWPQRYWKDDLVGWAFTQEQSTMLVEMMAPKVFGILLGYLTLQGKRQFFALIVGSDPPRNEKGTPTFSGPPRFFGLCVTDKTSHADEAMLIWIREQLFHPDVDLKQAAADFGTRFDRDKFAVYSGRTETAVAYASGNHPSTRLNFEIECRFPDAMTMAESEQGDWSWQMDVDVRKFTEKNGHRTYRE
jgi:hypothetical protein